MRFSTLDPESNKDLGFAFNPIQDTDLYLTLGNVRFSFLGNVVVNRDLRVSTSEITGTMLDLYDFDYDGGAYFGPLNYSFRSAARVQAGYNTEGTGGHVFKSKIVFQNTLIPIDYQFQ